MLILGVWFRGCSELIGSLGRRGGCRRLWTVFVLLLVLVLVLLLKRVEVEKMGILSCEAVGERRGGRSSSLIGGRLAAFLSCFVLLYRCSVVC